MIAALGLRPGSEAAAAVPAIGRVAAGVKAWRSRWSGLQDCCPLRLLLAAGSPRIPEAESAVAAQAALAHDFMRKSDNPTDDAAAFKWAGRAARKGGAHGQYLLGLCYYNGQGLERNFTLAARWLHRSARQNTETAAPAKKVLNKLISVFFFYTNWE